MFVRKNYYLYAENAEKQNEKKKLLGSVRLTRIEEQWTMEIQWKDENDAAALVSKAEEEELQLQIKEKEIILRCKKRDLREDQDQGKPVGEQNEAGSLAGIYNEEKKISVNTEKHQEQELSENTEKYIEEDAEDAADTNADKTEEQELAVTATENIRKEDKQEEDKQEEDKQENGEQENEDFDIGFLKALHDLKKGDHLPVGTLEVKEGETSPPKRYNSGSMILTMENAGQFIEDEELRSQIKGSGIGTSATRAEILKKLFNINYLSLNKKTQIITPTLMGEMIYEVVGNSIRPLLDPALTASWEKGLTMVAEGTITEEEYMKKLDDFVRRRTNVVKQLNNQSSLTRRYQEVARNYSSKGSAQKGK